MYAIDRPGRPRAAGFTLIEALVAVAILGIVLGVGMPRMSEWLLVGRATGAAEFYAEGIRLARQTAIARNAATRFRLIDNTSNGQFDWQVDLCIPTAIVACTETTGEWTTTTSAVAGDKDAAPFKSVFRESLGVPNSAVLTHTLSPVGNNDIYFTAVGWVDTTYPDRMERLTLVPSTAYAGKFPASQLDVGLAGLVSKCDPTATSDAMRCQ